jgi:hypothetical protein
MEELQTKNKGYYNENTKKATYKWRNSHREQWHEYRRPLSLKYYYQNAENVKKRKREKYQNAKEFREYLRIYYY